MPPHDRAIEAGARAVTAAQMKWKAENGGDKASCVDCPDELIAAAVITAYEAHLKAEGFVVVPVEPTEAMWGGLARDLVMWDRGLPNQYGSTLYKHLRACGREIPDWLLAEIPDIDHTPPKGTVAVCIYRAMLSAATTGENDASDR